jgi:hypothetical protein
MATSVTSEVRIHSKSSTIYRWLCTDIQSARDSKLVNILIQVTGSRQIDSMLCGRHMVDEEIGENSRF